MTEPEKKPQHPAEVGCTTCSSSIMTTGRGDDGRGGKIFAYICGGEVVVNADGTVRTIRACPDIDGEGGRDPKLSR